MPHLSPQTLTLAEQRATAGNLRDHLIYSLALGTGLRLAEIVGLNLGDVYLPNGSPRTRIRLRPELVKGGRSADVFLPDSLVRKIRRFRRHKRRAFHGLRPGDPLFCSQGGKRRISPRRVQFAFRTWQVKAGFDRLYPFHALRHTAVTNVYRSSKDLFLAQRFARHVSPLTTTIYTHPSDQELWQGIRQLHC
jgi:site-specific recombinase XerC